MTGRALRGLRIGTACSFVMMGVAACGESRLPIGEECLRGDDCLSGICSERTCVSAPPLVTGLGASPPSEEPLIPEGAASPADAGDGG